MQQRYYDPAIGRFLSVDPIASDMQNGWNFNRYNYAANNPYRFIDPDGRSIWTKGAKLLVNGGDLAATTYGLVEDFNTASDSSNSFLVRLGATLSMASEILPVSVGDAKDGARIVGNIANRADGAQDASRTAVSMEEAIDRGISHVGSDARVIVTPKGNVQFSSTEIDAAGNTVTRNARFDVNPADPHVQREGAHLNLETQVNGRSNGTDPHTPIDPATIRRGDYE